MMQRLRNIDWDAIAGIAAAVTALVLHFIGVAKEGVLLAIALVILALVLLRDLRREAREERHAALAEQTAATAQQLQSLLTPPDTVLIGPTRLRVESERFARRARDDMVWFNVCLLMFAPQTLFDALLRPAIENPAVTGIQFVLDSSERETWKQAVLPKIAACPGKEKVREPRWCELKETISFILSPTDPDGSVEAHLSFWGEPFMARQPGRDVPRYIFHVQGHSELIARLIDLERSYRLGG